MRVTAEKAWAVLGTTTFGRWLFVRIICLKAPYFATIHPRFRRLEPGICEIELRKRRAVLNHIGTVHAIAMCNAAELAAGLVTEVTLPPSYRWIPKRMHVEYLKPARTNLVATARCTLPISLSECPIIDVVVETKDAAGLTVFQAVVSMYVSTRR
jgi:acyl-coenzyme A thioesterase PaaI-like protein